MRNLQERAHLKVCELARDAMPEGPRKLVAMLWKGIERGARAPDEVRVFRELDEHVHAAHRGLTHRCYVDSDDPTDQASPVQISRYATATVALIEDFARGGSAGPQDTTEFRRKCGLGLGVTAHFVADLWTPVHLGRSLQPPDLHHRHRRGFHWGVEADLEKAAAVIEGPLDHRAQPVPLDSGHYARLASQLYRHLYLALPAVYGKNRWAEDVRRFATRCIVGAACTTADVWVTVAASSPVEEVLRRAGEPSP